MIHHISNRWDDSGEIDHLGSRNNRRDSLVSDDSDLSDTEQNSNSVTNFNRKFSIINDWQGKKLIPSDLMTKNKDYIIEQWQEDDDLGIQ